MDVMMKRIENFRNKLSEQNFDAAFITKRENYMYLSGFTGTSAFLLITQDDLSLITDFRYVEQAEKQAPHFNIVKYQGSETAEINNIIKKKHIEILGFEDGDLTYKKHEDYLKKLEVRQFKPLGAIVEELRIRKDEAELSVIKKAVEIADAVFIHMLGVLKPGIAEVEAAAELEYKMKKLGATGASFDTIIASGLRSSLPHGVASEKKLEAGDTVTLDFGAIYKGYCSDMTRTVFLGEPSAEMKKIYGIVLDAQLKSSNGARKGLTGKQIDAIARNIIAEAGYGEYFGHGLGHGVGLEIHEEPRFSISGTVVMDDNMVVTAEPGIYVPGTGGVRIEDMLVIKGDQPLVLTSSTKEMIIL